MYMYRYRRRHIFVHVECLTKAVQSIVLEHSIKILKYPFRHRISVEISVAGTGDILLF